ncbi:MAG TPA: phosphate ABC transporter ATP-binding protein, partial [Herpetosiphonaceae bacterium]|nr:phosphate ABC transporter ATP-binding protein [Herpetosiphonaceae bacterium]
MLEIRRLTYATAAGEPLLKDVSFRVEPGAIVTLLGPSGSGKSTLLRTLNRLNEPPAGSVWLDGADITAMPVVALRRAVGMVFQSAALFDGTVAANIRYGPALGKRELSDAECRELLAQVGLDEAFLDRPAASLSGGQAQRVAFARALANQPRLLLLDEPTSALDPAATLTIERLVLGLRARLGLTCVWVTHNIEQARRVSDQTVLLVGGV